MFVNDNYLALLNSLSTRQRQIIKPNEPVPPRRLRGVPSNINDMDSNSTQIFLKIQFETGDYDGSSATVNWRCFEII